MRILVATDQWFPDVQAGPARLAADSARALAARGHDVTVLAPRNGKAGDEVEAGVAVRRVLARGRLPQTVTDPLATWRQARLLAGRRFDLLLAHESTAAAGLLAEARRTPLVYLFHASAAREQRFLRAQLPRGLRRAKTYALAPSLALLERRAVTAATTILVLSDFSRGIVLADHDVETGSVRTVPGLVDTARFSPGDGQAAARERLDVDPETRLLLSARRLEPRMGLDRLLHALCRLEHEDVVLTVAGTGSLAESLRRLAEELGLASRVRFLGRIPDEQLTDWLRAADLFVLPTIAYEGFGMATAEALASGTPVVGTAIGATAELLEPLDPRLVTEGVEPPALATAIDAALEFASGTEYRAGCRAYAVERFALDTAIESWERALVEAAAVGARA